MENPPLNYFDVWSELGFLIPLTASLSILLFGKEYNPVPRHDFYEQIKSRCSKFGLVNGYEVSIAKSTCL